ncbi:nuclear transport factor 2 family protein [Sphingobacterium sp. InxBP1]|uniref:nuclear transport factor 2 family protein n=1 Tax=Sphingobacterium sp. InxBP1 TaxID=2870328 RepID=UPI0022443713|nr:nuclear transport factor 2 family protein [Sphingobacterium sp. InxBP1]MCW8311407.1 nuclear transport factor 2 family protein [Sphingobacterium sp. InxBP1]
MKNLVKTFVAAAMIAITTCSMASVKPEERNLVTADLAVEEYVGAMTEGQVMYLDKLFTSDFNQKICGKQDLSHSRSQMIEFLKKQKGIKMNCKTTTQIVEELPDYAIAKITMQFDGFSKTDLITLVKENGTWKVSKSVNSYR